MSGATPKGSLPGIGSPIPGRLRGLLVLGFLAGMILIFLLKPSKRGSVPLEQVSRNQLVLQQGRLMKTSQTNAFTGLMVEFYPDGTLQSRSVVSNGLLHGVSRVGTPTECWPLPKGLSTARLMAPEPSGMLHPIGSPKPRFLQARSTDPIGSGTRTACLP